MEDDAFKIFMHESKAAGDVFQSIARHRCNIICDADGPDGLVYCDKIASEKQWTSVNGLRVMEFYLIMTREDYNENTKEESRMGPVYLVDISRKGRPLALMIHPGHGTVATDSTQRLIREIIDSLKSGLDFWSRCGMNSVATATTDWKKLETPFFLQPGQKAEKVTINIVINGKGTVWVDDVRLLKAPLK